MHDIQIIIMAGGVGSRFWPMSTPDYPKQFIDVMGVARSLIQLTVDRLKPICPVENMWVVTNEKYIDDWIDDYGNRNWYSVYLGK